MLLQKVSVSVFAAEACPGVTESELKLLYPSVPEGTVFHTKNRQMWADLRITLGLYAQGEEEAKRAAQKHVSGIFVVEKAS